MTEPESETATSGPIESTRPEPDGRIVVERTDACVTVTIDRAHKRNALSTHLQNELADALDRLADDESIGVLVITAVGDRSFVAGGDLTALRAVRTFDDARAMALHARSVLDRIRRFPAPVVAALNSDALGGGAELAMACDFRIAAAGARMAFVQGRHAISTAWGGGADLIQLVGHSRAMRLLTTCAFVDHDAGLAIGLYDRCGGGDEPLSTTVEEFVKPMLQQPPSVLRTYKAMTVAARMTPARAAVEATELERFVEGWVHEDHWAALDAYLNRGGRTQ